MEQQLRELIKSDETLLWSGCPEPFETLDKTNKSAILRGLVIKGIIALVLVVFYLTVIVKVGGFKPGVVIVILACTALAMANPFLMARRLRKNTIYGLTDKRILRSGAHSESVPYERIRRAELRTDEDGHVSLLCGPRPLKHKPHSWRGDADAPFINSFDEAEADRAVLYALPMNDALRAILKERLPLK